MRTSRLIIALALTVLLGGKALAQPAPLFDGIRCRGEMPADLRKSMEQLYMEDKQRVRDYNNGKLPNRDKVLTSSYYISRLMSSGRILYGDPVSLMMNRIADTLLAAYPDIRNELRIYTVKSSEVNAFTTGQGMIFVNLGLVAQVEDEAQLAFVLSHEIIHYVRKHNLEMLARKHTNKDTTSEAGLADFLRYHSRSREMEREADSLGIEMFYANSPYDKRVTDGFFDVLQYGYLPFDEIEFDTAHFNTEHFKLSKGTFLDQVKPISAREDYNDSLSTHPNLMKRRLATSNQLASLAGGSHYVVTTEKEFDELRTLARMECIRQDLILAEYASAYYNCYVLLRRQPDNAYLHLAKAQAIYGASKFRTYAAASSTSDYRDKEGEIQQVYHLMRRAKPNELCIAAIRDVWETHRRLPQEPRLTAMTADLIGDLHIKHKFKTDQFADAVDTAAANDEPDTVATSGNSKYANVKRRRRQQQTQQDFRYAFVDLMQRDKDFKPLFDNAIRKEEHKKEQQASDKGAFLFAPSYYVFSDKTGDIKINKSVNGEAALVEDISEANTKSGIKTVDFSDASMRSHSDAAFYNDFMSLNEWTNEYWQSKSKVPMAFTTQPLMDSLIGRYGADKLSLGLVANAEGTGGVISNGNAILCILLGLTAPEAIYAMVTSHQTTLVQNLLVDTRDGSTISKSSNVIFRDDSRSLVRSQTYAALQKGLNPKRAPGYMNRHFIFEATGGLSFPILNRIFREKTDAIALRYGGAAEIAVGRQSSIALNIDFAKTTFDINWEPESDASIITGLLSYRHYLGENIAPLGPYAGGGITLNKLKLTPKAPGGTYQFIKDSQIVPALTFEVGHNAILYDYIVLNFGVRYSATLANPIEKLDESFYSPLYADPGTTYVTPQRAVNANLWMYNLISLHIGIGLLPF